ncbi:MAG: glycosyltransferase [Chloroflexota bacterium]
MRLVVYTTVPWEHALAMLRYRAPADALGWDVFPGKDGANDVHPERVADADVVLIQRDFPRFFESYLDVMEQARRLGRLLVYDLDDLLLALPVEHPNRQDYFDSLGGMLHAMLEADVLVLSTPLLADIFRPLNPRGRVWPTALPEAYWQVRLPQERAADAPLVIGYMGGSTHLPDVEMIVPLLARLLDDYPQMELHFWGAAPPDSLRICSRVRHCLPEKNSYAGFVSSFEQAIADVWIAPLRPTLFNRCKSSIKFWEYSAIGGVGVYSRLEPYQGVVRDGENGLLAASLDEWDTALRRLVNDSALRLRLACNAQATLQDSGWLRQHLDAWEAILRAPQPVTTAMNVTQQTLARLSEQVQHRSDGHHLETLELLAAVSGRDAQIANRDVQLANRNAQIADHDVQLADRNAQIQILTHRSNQLDEVFQSRSWRALQRLQKLRRFDFSPLPSFESFMLPYATHQPSSSSEDPPVST